MKINNYLRSKSKQNILNYKKASLLLKYSNSTLFQKRELFQSKKSEKFNETKTFYNNSKTINKTRNNFKPSSPKIIKKVGSYPLLLNSLSSYQTSSTTNTIVRTTALKKSPTVHYTPTRKTPQLYLTESELIKKNIVYDSEEEKAIEEEKKKLKMKFKQKKVGDEFMPKTPDYRNRTKDDTNSVNLLLYIQKELNKFRERKKDDKNIDLKIKDLNRKEYGSKKLMKKTKKYKFLQYITSTKKDRAESLDEEHQAKIGKIQERINFLQEALELFNVKFINKLSHYIKYIIGIRNEEKIQNLSLLKQKIEYKKEIEQINSEIEKLQIKKNKIIKWIYLQIKVKEKKLILKNYYKTIIESNKSEILLLQSKFNENNNDSKDVRKNSNRHDTSKRKKTFKRNYSISIFSDKNLNLYLKKASDKSLTNRISRINFDMNNNAHNEIENYKLNMNMNSNKNAKIKIGQETITKEEFDKILFWKFSPIFKTSEEFMDRLKDLDSQNILLLQYFNKLQSVIFNYQKELLILNESQDKNEKMETHIDNKKNELDLLKKKFSLITKKYSRIKENRKKSKKNYLNPQISYGQTNISNNNISEMNMTKIYDKINELFESCKYVNNEKLTNLLYYNIKTSITKEEEIIFTLEYIECTIDFLFERMRYYKRDENKNILLQQKLIEIDKIHKKEKPKKQRLEELKNNLILQRKLEMKNNRKLILPSRKLNLYHYNMRNKKRKNKNDIKNKDNFPTLDDFMKNANMINKVDNIDFYSDDDIKNVSINSIKRNNMSKRNNSSYKNKK